MNLGTFEIKYVKLKISSPLHQKKDYFQLQMQHGAFVDTKMEACGADPKMSLNAPV